MKLGEVLVVKFIDIDRQHGPAPSG
jgi:hypothetical protein